jgi:flagellar basal body-associated protein FliL
MTEDRTTIVEVPRAGGSSGWVIAAVLIVALVVGLVFFTQMSGSQNAKNNAITNAANQVGDAAGQVGTAAKQAGNAAQDAANNTNKK